MQRRISSIPISLSINKTPLAQCSVLPLRTLSPSLCAALRTPFVQTAPSARCPPTKLSLLRVWHHLWVFQGQWTEIWGGKNTPGWVHWSCLTLSQTHEIQLYLDDSSSGLMGFLFTLVSKRKPVIDSFQKWLEACMVYMLVIVTAYPGQALISLF